jgi:hypothetical protein
MSERLGSGPVRSNRLNVVELHCKLTFGSSGAVTLTDSGFGAIAGVTKAATGRYTFTLRDRHSALLAVRWAHDTQGTVKGSAWEVFAGYSASAGTVTLSCVESGSEANPASGVVTDLVFTVKASSEG